MFQVTERKIKAHCENRRTVFVCMSFGWTILTKITLGEDKMFIRGKHHELCLFYIKFLSNNI